MPGPAFRNFCDLAFLQGIDKPKYIAPLLRRYARYFKRQGVDVSALDNADATDRKLLEVLTQPNETMPSELREALHILDRVADEVGRNRIQAELDGSRLGIRGVADLTPGEFAIAVYLRKPDLIQSCYDMTVGEKVRQFDEFQSRSNRKLTLSAAQRKESQLKRALSGWFVDQGRGGLCDIHVYTEEDEIVFLITHGRNYRSVGTVEQDRRRSRLTYRPQKHDVVMFNMQTHILKVNAQFQNEKDLYRRCFGEVLFGDPINFPGTDIYSLRPMQRQNFKLKLTADIRNARVSEVWILVQDEHRLLERCSAYDILESARRQGRPNLQQGEIIRSTILIRYATGGRERKLELRPPNVADYDRDRDAKVTERFIEENGFARAKRQGGK